MMQEEGCRWAENLKLEIKANNFCHLFFNSNGKLI